MIAVDISPLQALGSRFGAMPSSIDNALQNQMQATMSALVTDVQTNKLSGQVLNVRSGRLRDSITASVDSSGAITSGTVGSDVPYAAIHEYGGTILRARLKPYSIVEPERSFLRSTQDEQAGNVQAQLTEAVRGAIDD